MMQQTIVVALGGNAILSKDASAQSQQQAVMKTVRNLVKLVAQGHRLVITHGNGPQVGNLLLQQAASNSVSNPAMPLDTCVGMTEGSIGYWLQNAIGNVLRKQHLTQSVVSLITQVVVDASDSAFTNLTKPIGPFLSAIDAERANANTGDKYIEDAGRGYRKVVASPKPVRIQEIEVIQQLLNQEVIVIAAGGGGIPVIEKNHHLIGVEAVIDKDFASQQLAAEIQADSFIILTEVEHVYINYNQSNQQKLEKVTVAELEHYIQTGQFAAGSMLPKIEAVISFVKAHPKGRAIISSLENIEAVLAGTGGTVITCE